MEPCTIEVLDAMFARGGIDLIPGVAPPPLTYEERTRLHNTRYWTYLRRRENGTAAVKAFIVHFTARDAYDIIKMFVRQWYFGGTSSFGTTTQMLAGRVFTGYSAHLHPDTGVCDEALGEAARNANLETELETSIRRTEGPVDFAVFCDLVRVYHCYRRPHSTLGDNMDVFIERFSLVNPDIAREVPHTWIVSTWETIMGMPHTRPVSHRPLMSEHIVPRGTVAYRHMRARGILTSVRYYMSSCGISRTAMRSLLRDLRAAGFIGLPSGTDVGTMASPIRNARNRAIPALAEPSRYPPERSNVVFAYGFVTNEIRRIIEHNGCPAIYRAVFCSYCGESARGCYCGGSGSRRFQLSQPYSRGDGLRFHGGEALKRNCLVPRYVGVELEIAGFDSGIFDNSDSSRTGRAYEIVLEAGENHISRSKLVRSCQSWGAGIKFDGSLYGDSAREIVLAPCRNGDALKQFRDITDGLRREGAWVDSSCGGHVHVDVGGMSTRQVNATFALWYLLEDLVIDKLAPGRTASQYCREMRRYYREENGMCFTPTELAHNQTWAGGSYNLFGNHETRYQTLNRLRAERVDGVFHGTLEFRLFPGTVSYNRCLVNASVVSRIVDFAVTHTRAQLRDAYGMTRHKLLRRICGKRTWEKASKLPTPDFSRSTPRYFYECGGV